MPKRRYERREPSHEWQQIQPLLKDTAQIQYEIIRPVVLWGQTPKERGAETGVSPRTIYYRANLFDEAGMASPLPPDIRQEIVDLHAQYPEFRPHELATICFVKFNRKPAPATIKLILASGPKPSTTERIGDEALKPAIGIRVKMAEVRQDREKPSSLINVSCITTPPISERKGRGIRADAF